MRAMHRTLAIANTLPVRAPLHSYLIAFAPIFDSQGDFVATLGVDMVLDDLDARMASMQRASALALFVVTLLSALAGYVALRIRKFSATIVTSCAPRGRAAEQNAAAAESASRAKAGSSR